MRVWVIAPFTKEGPETNSTSSVVGVSKIRSADRGVRVTTFRDVQPRSRARKFLPFEELP